MQAGASGKLPSVWEKKICEIIHQVGKAQTPVNRDGVLIPAFCYDDLYHSNHIPVYMDLVGEYTWGEMNSGIWKIGTGLRYRTCFKRV